jgi:hypothetical protein
MNTTNISSRLNKFRVWRVQNKDGDGPYYDDSVEIDRILKSHYDTKRYPSPIRDKKIRRYMQTAEICAFLNLEQVYNWFSKDELDALSYCGYELKRILVRKITAIGEKQILVIR